ncbi:MAG: hydrogenase maturation protease [Euryarchaeota archaeon]|nr:hydrogenase maturation protease [Euryarchaeota archaeon]
MLVLGLGNTLMGDDGVGIHAVRRLSKLGLKGVELAEGGVRGIGLLSELRGRRRVVIIDAVRGGGGEPGTIYRITGDELADAELSLLSLHHFALEHVLTLGRELLGEEFPEEIVIYGVEVERVRLGEGLSEPVERALARLVELVAKEVAEDVPCNTGSGQGDSGQPRRG